MGGISFSAQLIGSALGVTIALVGGFIVYGVLKRTMGLKLSPEEEHAGADLSIHQITSTPGKESAW